MYNIHPLLVHFPIAFLFLYSVIKILPFKRWFPKVAWRDIERVLLLVGVLGAFAALATGDAAEHLAHPNRQLVDAHATFGAAATWIYGALLVGEFAAVINAQHYAFKNWRFVSKLSLFLEKVLRDRIFAGFLAVVGLVAISVTGMLGGVLAYGATADPVAPLLLKVLGISL